MTVADAWQGRGVATALLQALQRHRPEGITKIDTEVAGDNVASLAILHRLGDTELKRSGGGCMHVVIGLTPCIARKQQPDQKPDRLRR